MRNSRFVLAALAALVAGEAAAQSTLNYVVVPPASGVVVPPRGMGGPRLTAPPAGIRRTAPLPLSTPPVVLPDSGVGLAAPGIAAIALPAIAAALLGGRGGGGSSAAGGVGAGSATTAPARTR